MGRAHLYWTDAQMCEALPRTLDGEYMRSSGDTAYPCMLCTGEAVDGLVSSRAESFGRRYSVDECRLNSAWPAAETSLTRVFCVFVRITCPSLFHMTGNDT